MQLGYQSDHAHTDQLTSEPTHFQIQSETGEQILRAQNQNGSDHSSQHDNLYDYQLARDRFREKYKRENQIR